MADGPPSGRHYASRGRGGERGASAQCGRAGWCDLRNPAQQPLKNRGHRDVASLFALVATSATSRRLRGAFTPAPPAPLTDAPCPAEDPRIDRNILAAMSRVCRKYSKRLNNRSELFAIVISRRGRLHAEATVGKIVGAARCGRCFPVFPTSGSGPGLPRAGASSLCVADDSSRDENTGGGRGQRRVGADDRRPAASLQPLPSPTPFSAPRTPLYGEEPRPRVVA